MSSDGTELEGFLTFILENYFFTCFFLGNILGKLKYSSHIRVSMSYKSGLIKKNNVCDLRKTR